jgi:hypothetical protein
MIAKIAKIAEIEIRECPHRFSIVNFGSLGNIGNCNPYKEYQTYPFDSAARSVYFLKFARPRPNPEVKH